MCIDNIIIITSLANISKLVIISSLFKFMSGMITVMQNNRLSTIANNFIQRLVKKQDVDAQYRVQQSIKLQKSDDTKKPLSKLHIVKYEPNALANNASKPKNDFNIRYNKKYRSYSVQFKKRMIQQINKQCKKIGLKYDSVFEVFRAKAEQYGIHIKNLKRWYNLKQIKQRVGGRKPAHPELQQKMAEFIRAHPRCKKRDIIQFAKEQMYRLAIPGVQNFRFSKGWYERFKLRNLKKFNQQNMQVSDCHLNYHQTKNENIILVAIENQQYQQNNYC